MRPKKRILLACQSEDRLSVLRFLLGTHAYAVTGAETVREALGHLDGNAFDLVLVDWPFDGSGQLVDRAHELEICSVALSRKLTAQPDGCDADMFVGKSALESYTLLDRVKVATARRRGPKPLKKPVESVVVNDQSTWAVNSF